MSIVKDFEGYMLNGSCGFYNGSVYDYKTAFEGFCNCKYAGTSVETFDSLLIEFFKKRNFRICFSDKKGYYQIKKLA